MTEPMSVNKSFVETYIGGFRTGNHELILSCLTDDITWEMPGYFNLSGKGAFDKEIENDAFEGRPNLTIDRLIEEEDAVVAIGTVQVAIKDGGVLNAVFCDVFDLKDGKIQRLVTYQVNLTPLSQLSL